MSAASSVHRSGSRGRGRTCSSESSRLESLERVEPTRASCRVSVRGLKPTTCYMNEPTTVWYLSINCIVARCPPHRTLQHTLLSVSQKNHGRNTVLSFTLRHSPFQILLPAFFPLTPPPPNPQRFTHSPSAAMRAPSSVLILNSLCPLWPRPWRQAACSRGMHRTYRAMRLPECRMQQVYARLSSLLLLKRPIESPN